jgi:hypothetical protein
MRAMSRNVRVPVVCALIACASSAGCKKRSPEASTTSPSSAPSSGAIAPASAAPNVATPRFERFIDAHAKDGGVEVAGVTRDNAIVLVDYDASLAVRARKDLAQGFVAGDSTRVVLAPAGLVVVNGKLGGEAQTWLLSQGTAPRAMSPEWCEVDRGVAWLVRDDQGVRVRFVRRAAPAIDATSSIVGAPTSLAFLDCGDSSLAVSLRDGEKTVVVRLAPSAADFATAKPTPIEVDAPDDHSDDPREVHVLPRGDELAIVYVGEQHLEMRLLRAGQSTPTPWVALSTAAEAGKPPKEFSYAFENDVVAITAAPKAGGPVYLLSNEPMPAGGSCPPTSEPVRTVLHALEVDADGKKGTVVTRPIVELPCGVDAIPARLTADATGAHVWWTEPVEDGSCAQAGLGVGAIVEAGTERPGARHAKMLAESVVRLDDARYLAVVREGGCAEYKAPGNGALAWAPTPK